MINSNCILEYLPLAINIWTGLTLCWGIFVGYWFDRILKIPLEYDHQHRIEDDVYVFSIWCANSLIFIVGFILPLFTPDVGNSIGDAVIVLNVFYTSFLISCTIGLIRWTLVSSRNNQLAIINQVHPQAIDIAIPILE